MRKRRCSDRGCASGSDRAGSSCGARVAISAASRRGVRPALSRGASAASRRGARPALSSGAPGRGFSRVSFFLCVFKVLLLFLISDAKNPGLVLPGLMPQTLVWSPTPRSGLMPKTLVWSAHPGSIRVRSIAKALVWSPPVRSNSLSLGVLLKLRGFAMFC